MEFSPSASNVLVKASTDLSEVDWENFQPLADRIVVKRKDDCGTTLIMIPDAYRTPERFVEVLAVGPKVREVRRGDVVLVPGMALLHPDFEEKEFALITEGDVGGIYA